jgi:CRP-like cAMP-binding protein
MDLNCPVIDELRPEDQELVRERMISRRLARNETLYVAGDRARRTHVVASGMLKLCSRSAHGDESILALAIPGELVGEISTVDGLPQPLDAVAAAPTEVLGVDADLLMGALARSPGGAIALAEQLTQRMRWICDTALERSTGEVPARLAGRLLDLADMLGRVEQGAVEFDLPLAQHELGRLAGMCRESACKTLRRFKKAGVVDYRGRRLRILRPDVLERVRCAGRMRGEAEER